MRPVPPKSSVPVIVAILPGLPLFAVMAATFNQPDVPVLSVGAFEPPLLLKTSAANVLVPESVTVELPLIVKMFVGSMAPTVWVKLPPLSVKPPAGKLPPARLRVAPFTTVPAE